MRRDRKKRLTRVFAVITAVSLLLLFIVRDVFRENLKDVHDRVAQATALYEILYGQNENYSAIRSEGQSVENLQRKFMALRGAPDPSNPSGQWKPASDSDIVDLSRQASLEHNKAQDELYFVSELIDTLPSSAADLRKLRDEYRARLEQDGMSRASITPLTSEGPGSVPHPPDSRRAWEIYENIAKDHSRVISLGFASVRAANDALKAMERRISICSYLIYILGVVVAAFGIYAAIVLKPEGNEPNR